MKLDILRNSMKNIWQKIKIHWGITNDFQVAVILLVFALSGFSTLYVHNYVDHLLGIDEGSAFWAKLLVFVLIVLPVFNTFLIIWGTVFRQQKFFRKFIKTKIRLLTKGFLFRK